jgi:tRNA U34 5-carboxymethylaminomethyl modifying GTPase MnmE/TrmE
MQLFETSLQEKRELYKLKNEQKSHFQVSLETSKKLLSEQKEQEKILQQEKNSFIQAQTKLQNISQNLENISEKIAQF